MKFDDDGPDDATVDILLIAAGIGIITFVFGAACVVGLNRETWFTYWPGACILSVIGGVGVTALCCGLFDCFGRLVVMLSKSSTDEPNLTGTMRALLFFWRVGISLVVFFLALDKVLSVFRK